MKRTIGMGLVVLGLALGSAAGPAGGQPAPGPAAGPPAPAASANAQPAPGPAGGRPTPPNTREAAERTIAGWPAPSRRAARALLAEYGAPDEINPNRVQWNERGSFKRIAVRAVPPPLAFGGIVENTVRADVPNGVGLVVFKGAVVLPDPDARELSAMSGDESANVLALNRENRVLSGLESVAQARRAYGRALELKAAGKTSPETQRILFNVKGP
jgi:hypothetical protein